MADSIFPHIKKAVEDFMFDQEGNIPRNKVLSIGSMLLILGLLLTDDAFAAHRSHSSHRSHTSHSSHSSGSGGHSSHESHSSHVSHTSSSSGHSSGSDTIWGGSSGGSTSGGSSGGVSHSSAPAHNNAPPSLTTLNGIRSPDQTDTVDLAPAMSAVAAGQIPPATTPVAITESADDAQEAADSSYAAEENTQDE